METPEYKEFIQCLLVLKEAVNNSLKLSEEAVEKSAEVLNLVNQITN